MRRLLWASLPRMLGVTRNPSRRFVLEKADTSFNTGNAEGFRVSPNNHPTKPGDFAWLRTRPGLLLGFFLRKGLKKRRFLKQREAENLQNVVQAPLQLEFFLDDGYQDIDAYGNPDLRLHRVLGRSIKGLDPQVLLDPFEE